MSAHHLLFMGEQPETFDRERLYDGTEPPHCDLCAKPAVPEKGFPADDLFCFGCRSFICLACHESREMPTEPHVLADHKTRGTK